MTVACYKSYSLNVTACDASTDWLTAPGTCRLRIKNFHGADWANSTICFDARAGVVNPWDGTFSQIQLVVSPQPGYNYLPDPAIFQTLGGVYLGSAGTTFIWFNSFVPRWRLNISYQTNSLSDGGRWVGDRFDPSPLGVYSLNSRCNVGLPDTVEIEPYSL